MTISGGIRMRMLNDSVRVVIIAALADLGWFDATKYDVPAGSRQHHPVTFAAKPEDWAEVVPPNVFSITGEDFADEESELGSQAIDDTHTFFFDFFAESDSVGSHLAWDVHSILLGHVPSIGRTSDTIDMYDFRQATPSAFQELSVERAAVQRVDGFPRPWQKHWWTVRFDVVDDHSEYEGATIEGVQDWGDDLAHAWFLVQEVI